MAHKDGVPSLERTMYRNFVAFLVTVALLAAATPWAVPLASDVLLMPVALAG